MKRIARMADEWDRHRDYAAVEVGSLEGIERLAPLELGVWIPRPASAALSIHSNENKKSTAFDRPFLLIVDKDSYQPRPYVPHRTNIQSASPQYMRQRGILGAKSRGKAHAIKFCR